MWIACTLTVLMEGVFFWINGFRKASDILLISATNVFTNLLLNYVLFHLAYQYILPGEILVILCEYLIYRIAYGKGMKLFVLTFLANLLSYTCGILLF